MRRMSRFHFLIFGMCIVYAVLGSSKTHAQEFGNIAFTCPPCGCEGDSLRLEQAGQCPVCGMHMVEKSGLNNVAVLIYDGIQLADMAGAYSVFEAARTFTVYTVGARTDPIVLGGLKIAPQYTFDDSPRPDILIVPGGGVGRQLTNSALMKWIQDSAKEAKLVLSVCTGAFIMAKTGLLDGRSATVLEEDIDQLRRAAPKVNVISGRRFVDNGKYLSSAGPSSGIDASLHMLTRIFGNKNRARAVAKFLDYPWSE